MTAAFQRMKRADAALHLLVAGEPRLALGRDGVDVVGAAQRRDADLLLAGPLEEPQHHVARALAAAVGDHGVEGLEPLPGLLGIDVGQLGRQALVDHRGLVPCRGSSAGRSPAHRVTSRRAGKHHRRVSTGPWTRALWRARLAPLRQLRWTTPQPRPGERVRSSIDGGTEVSATAGGGSTQTATTPAAARLHAGHGRPGARLGQRHRRRPARRDRGHHRRRHGRRRLRQRRRRGRSSGGATTTETWSTASSTRSPIWSAAARSGC